MKKTFQFGERVESDLFSFVLHKNNSYAKILDGNNQYFSFMFHDIRTLLDRYVKNTTINPINKDASVLKLNIKGNLSFEINILFWVLGAELL